MSDVKISQLPYVGKSGYTATDIVPFVSYINPTGTTSETKIDDLKNYVLDNTFVENVIKVGKGGDVDFTSLYDAVQSISGPSFTNRYSIQVGSGVYVEPPINLSNKPYVSIVGVDINSVVITPDNPSNIIFRLGDTGQISFLTISGATSGVGIACDDLDGFALAHKVSMYDNDVQISVTSSIANTEFFGEYIDLNGSYTYGVYVIANSPTYTAFASLENHFNEPTGVPTIANFCQGIGSQISYSSGNCIGDNTSGSIAFKIEDNANLIVSSVNISNWDIGFRVMNIGGPSTFDIDGVSIIDSLTYDLSVDHSGTQGTIQGSLSHQKIFNVSEDVYWSFLDHTDGELDITRKLSVTFKDGTHTDLSTLLFEGGTMGVLEGGIITIVSGTTISVSEGYGYLESIINNGVIKRFDWSDTLKELPQNSNQYLFINNNGILSNSGLRPNSVYNIVLGRVVTNSTDIVLIDASPLNANHTSNQYSNLFRNGIGPIYSKGSIVTENITPYNIDVTGGDYYYSTNEFFPDGGNGITFTMYYRDGGTGWSTSATTQVVVGYDDNSGTISPLSISAFTKHTLYVVGDAVNEQYFLVLGQNQYPTLIQAENALLPLPPTYFSDSVTEIASIYVRQGGSNIYQIEDIRPIVGFKAGGVNASATHGNLLGLSADDHTQYLLVDGSRPMVGDINMGGNDIYSASSITSDVISATTYNNLPIDPNTYVTGFTYGDNVFTVKQNNGQPDLTTTINSVTGMTVNGDLTVTGNTSVQSLTANTISATTYNNLPDNVTGKYLPLSGGTMTGGTIFQSGLTANTISATTYNNLPIDPNTYVTGFTYGDNVFTVKQNNGQPDLTTTINSVTGMTVNGDLTVTGNTSMKSVTATTVSASTLTLVSPNVPPTPSVSTPFIDDYGRVTLSPGGTPSLTYTNTNTGTGNATIVTNYLNIANGGTAGQSYTTVPLSGFGSPFNPTLSSNNSLSTIEWTFNLRTNRASIFAGFGASSYAGAVVLVGSNTNLQSAGSGYALVYGTTGTRNWKLVKYNNGLAGTQTDIITGGLFSGNTNYVSARIVYTPSTNTWSYYFRDDGASAWGDPTTTSTLIGSAVDSTYTSTLMSVFGVFFNYSTAASQNLQFDNLRVQQSVSASATTIDQLTLKNNSGTEVFKVKDDGTTTMSGTVTSSVGFFGSFSGTYTGNGSSLTLGQSGIMVTGTSQLNLTSATTALTLIPGLSTTITVSGQTMVYIQTNGGVNTLATTSTGGSALDVAILVDGAVLASGGYQRIYADNPTAAALANVTNWVANWNTSVILTLAAGSHTIEVDAVYVSGSSASVSGIGGSIKQGTLTVMVLKNN